MLRTFARAIPVARPFSISAALRNAQVFRMPAMSPTMTEGGIVSWKLKAGDEFASGDVLLEIETDKATIDVEAQDDGIVWEILHNDGETGIPVGKPIAFLAEPGDDLSSLQKPAVAAEPAPEKKPEPTPAPEKKPAPKEERKASKSAAASSDITTAANPAQKLTPAVEMLLHRNHISAEEAFEKIPASGPKGRLLKGDVMAYLGEIDAAAVSKVAQYIKNKEHLDLSNIKIAPPKPAAPAKPAAVEKPKPTNILSIDFTSELGEGVSREKFQYAFERALETAKKQVYGSRFPNYARSPVASGLYEEDIFDDLMVASVGKDRFEVYDIAYQFVGASAAPVAADPFDELLGLAPKAPVVVEQPESVSALVSFKIKYDAKLSDSKDFVDFFQDSLLAQIPAKQLVIRQ